MKRAVQYSWIFLLLGVGVFAGCKPSVKDPGKKIIYNVPIAKTRDVHTLYSDSAHLQIKLEAPMQWQFESGDGEYPKGISLVFYDKKGKVTNTVKANYGKYEKQKDAYFIRGNVIVSNVEKKETLRTEELNWDKQKRQIHTNKFVTIQTEDAILKGEGLTAPQDFSTYKILKPTGIFSIDAP